MKKVVTTLTIGLFVVGFSSVAFGQNLVTNGDLESWTVGIPDNWNHVENITQESTNIHGGTYSAAHQSASDTKDFGHDITGIVGGHDYTLSYWFLDNDDHARTRLWSKWKDDSGGTVGSTISTDYSTDNAEWQHYNNTITAPTGATQFYLEVRVYKEANGDYGGHVYYDDFSLVDEGGGVPDPEPTNHVTNFAATAVGYSRIDLSWTDATGGTLPDDYLIKASSIGYDDITSPSDGTPEADDTDLSDGSGTVNVNYGVESYSWMGLSELTTYHFKIYPYTNSGDDIDYKTDGTVPQVSATTEAAPKLPKVFINEIRANDAGTDTAEFIELIGPAGTNITGFKIIHYNGDDGQDGGLWNHTIGTFTIQDDGVTDNQGNNLGFYVLGCGGFSGTNIDETRGGAIQNGPDGIILYDASDNILDAVAWEGAGDMTDDDPGTVTTSGFTTSNNYLHVTLNDDNGDNSLQAPNNVISDDGGGWYLAEATIGSTNSSQTGGDISLPVNFIDVANISDDFQLYPCYPNPFNPTTNIGFSIPENCHVVVKIYDIKGNLIITLIDSELQRDKYNVIWNGMNFRNRLVASGVYLCQITTDKGFNNTQKMIFLR